MNKVKAVPLRQRKHTENDKELMSSKKSSSLRSPLPGTSSINSPTIDKNEDYFGARSITIKVNSLGIEDFKKEEVFSAGLKSPSKHEEIKEAEYEDDFSP